MAKSKTDNMKIIYPFKKASTTVFAIIVAILLTSSITAVATGGTYYCDPTNGVMSNNGSKANPWSTLEAVFKANKTFSAGDVIYLMDGNHGSAHIKSSNTDYVTITAYSGHNPILTKIQFSADNKYWKVDSLRFEAYGLNAKASGIINTYAGCENITVSNCYFTSIEDAVVFDYSNGTTATIWKEQTSSGINIIGDNAEVINCEFYNVHFGMRFSGNNITVKDNKIINFYADGIQISKGCNNTTVTGNIIKNAYVVDEQHDDGIQFWNDQNGGEVQNVVISNNIVINFSDSIPVKVAEYGLASEPMQAIILTDGWANNWVVENNLVVNSHVHGISIYGANDCRIQNNTVIKNPLFEYYQNNTSNPILQAPNATKPTAKTSANSIVRNNLGTKIATWAFPDNFTVEGNYDIDQSDLTNYTNCFVDYYKNDFHLKSTSRAVNTGINTDLSFTDLDSNARLFGENVDAGCYEYGSTPPSNVAPKLDLIGDITAAVRVAKTINILASDANGDDLTFSISNNPAFVTLTDNGNGTAIINISDESTVNATDITITVSDGSLSDNEIITLTIDEAASINNVNVLSHFTVYPNPIKGNMVNILFTESSTKQQNVDLMNLSGHVIYSSAIEVGTQQHTINMTSKVVSGIYLLQISSKNRITTQKMVVE